MSLVDISNVGLPLFIVGALFILLTFGLLSFGILRMFQQKYKGGWISIGMSVVSFVVFIVILNQWFLPVE